MVFNNHMSRLKNQYSYARGERKAEREIDSFLETVNASSSLNILAELKSATLED